jgi:hypothetical protein
MPQIRAAHHAAQGAWSALQPFPARLDQQLQRLAATKSGENRKYPHQLVKSG